MIERLHLQGLLSFGRQAEPIELGPLNVLVGPNGSGKSNFVEALSLLAAAPTRGRVAELLRRGGGAEAWMHAAAPGDALLTVHFAQLGRHAGVRHALRITPRATLPGVLDVLIDAQWGASGGTPRLVHYRTDPDRARGMVRSGGQEREIEPPELSLADSILTQLRDREAYPVLTSLSEFYEQIRFYRDWTFGPSATLRRTQPTDMPGDFLLPDASNLAMVFNELRLKPATKRRIVEMLGRLGQQFDDYETVVAGGTIQLFLREGDRLFPAVRLSDGTLRYLALLAVLLHPSPPPLVVIEEPELGLHPDLMPTLAELLIDASTRTQVVTTTHSDLLVDALSEHPEALLVFDRDEDGTQVRRLNAEEMKPWLEKFSLGRLWRMGEIGGNRW